MRRSSTRLLSAALSLFACGSFAPAQGATAYWRGSVAQGRAIEIRSINGDVFAEGYDGSEVEVVATVAGVDGVLAPVEVQAVQHEKGVTVCAVVDNVTQCMDDEAKPAKKPGGPRVNFNVRVPHGVGVIGRTVNGIVEAQRLDGDVEAYTTNGRISIQTTGSAQARSVNGSIFASLGNPFWRKPGEFSTVNGSITLHLPPATSTQLHAETVTGTVSTAFRLNNRLASNDKLLKGRIGSGTQLKTLKLKTINGSIQLNKAG